MSAPPPPPPPPPPSGGKGEPIEFSFGALRPAAAAPLPPKNASSSSIQKEFTMLPPPPALPSFGRSPRAASPVRVHSSTTSIPTLDSAPPSGNFDHPLAFLDEEPPIPTFGNSNNSSNKSSRTFVPPLPPPPIVSSKVTPTKTGTFRPPPPPPQTAALTPVTSVGSVSSASSPTFVKLPPPPPPVANSTPSSSSSTASSSPMMMFAQHANKTTSLVDADNAAEAMENSDSTLMTRNTFVESSISAQAVAPPFVPLMAFASYPKIGSKTTKSDVAVMARRHTHIPILIIATEQANRLAWKNGLRLADMFQGLVQPESAAGGAGTGGSGWMRNVGGQIPPFRSISKSIILNPSQIHLQFVEPETSQPCSSPNDLLYQHALLQESDGNLQQELILLEDRVDELLQTQPSARDTYSHGGGGSGAFAPPNRGGNSGSASNEDDSLESVVKGAYQLTSSLEIPWLVRYRNALDASTDHLPHDLIACPPVVVLICTTQEVEPPLDVLQELAQSSQYLPQSFSHAHGMYDSSKLRQDVLVLHDAMEGPVTQDNEILKDQLSRSFGRNADVVTINSVLPDTAKALALQETSDLWGGQGQKGNFLSVGDRVALRRYFTNLVWSSVVPALERRVADLNSIVNERKRGVRNVLKSFWRKPKDEKPMAPSTTGTEVAYSDGVTKPLEVEEVKYRHGTIESQTRLLGDTLFLLRDYDAALSIYRLIKDDYKADKANTHHGSINEMMALCLYHLDPYGRAKEIFMHLENALFSYMKAGEEEQDIIMKQNGGGPTSRPLSAPPSTRLATRLCLVLAAAQNMITGRELEVADLLASASSHETSLGAAVLLEQSSAFYHKAGMYRKYAFHMLMSGHMFRSAQQEHHAFRCFTCALYVYRHGQWKELHNHLRSALAGQLYSMGRFAVSLQLYAKLVGLESGEARGGKVSVKSQQKFLEHVIEICTDHRKKALACADRMAAPPYTSRQQRERVRKEQLDRIVQVIRFTKGASRVLELPNMCLPHVDDSSVQIWTPAEDFHGSGDGSEEEAQEESIDTSASSLGQLCKGEERVWNELMMTTTAEIKASESSNTYSLDESVSRALAKIDDQDMRKVIGQIDKEKQNRSLLERSKKSSGYKEKAKVRSNREPIYVNFKVTNPLAIDIKLSSIQLVATMKSNDKVCTSQAGIKITAAANKIQEQTSWTFQASSDTFEIAQFCRVSSGKSSWQAAEEAGPFFVVTKVNYTMAADEDLTLSLGICPLVEGELEVVGVRFQLSDAVWMYHPFNIKGPILKNTRANIEKRVRGESMLLKARIESEMPCLNADLVANSQGSLVPGGQTPLLDGQISSWILRVSNVGNAPADSLFLKTNLPWVNIPGQISGDGKYASKEASATSRCVGPTGTLMSLPISSPGLKAEGQIQPGETVDVPILLRTSGVGKEDFYILLRYELPQSNRQRWLKKMYSVPIYPSITISTSVVASSWNDEEHLLGVEITNNRNDQPKDLFVSLNKMSMASRKYRLEALPDQMGAAGGDTSAICLGWQERITLHFRIQPLDGGDEGCLLSDCLFRESGNDTQIELKKCAESSATNYLCLERAAEDFERTWQAHQLELLKTADSEEAQPRSISSIRRANTSDTATMSEVELLEHDSTNASFHPTSIGKLCPVDSSALSNVHVICAWSATSGGHGEQQQIEGEHHVREVSVRPMPSRVSNSLARNCPLTATADHPTSISNDFSNGPATVPITVFLRNQLVATTVNFSLETEEPFSCELVGIKSNDYELDGGGQLQLPFQAVIHRPGIHNLQMLKVTIKDEEDELHSFHFPMQQWLVTVTANE